jgi:hypothetical protein
MVPHHSRLKLKKGEKKRLQSGIMPKKAATKSGTKAEQVWVKIFWCLLINTMVPDLCMSVVNGSASFQVEAKKGAKKAAPKQSGSGLKYSGAY